MVQKRFSEAAKKRLRAGRMLQKGKGCAEVALAVGVARRTVYTWKALLDEGGIDALRAVPERGRPAQLDPSQLSSLRAALLQSPTEHGFGTELWTLKHVGTLIERMHGVRFKPGPCLAHSGRARLQCLKARKACHRAKRGCCTQLEAQHLASA